MIKVEDLSYTYPGSGKKAVDEASFGVEHGQVLGFLGPNGAGKSTTQNVMTGLLPLQEGKVAYDGRPLSSYGRSFFNKVGVSFEHPDLYDRLTGVENLQYYAALFSSQEMIAPRRVLDMVGLGNEAEKRVSQYSKGMKQRLVFARAIQNRPAYLFLDEPTAGLDPGTAASVKEIILQEKKRGAAVFLTTHNMFLADELCDVVAFLNDGQILAQDSPRSLKLKYGERALRVEYREDGSTRAESLFIEREEDQARLSELVASGSVETIHSQEATLEQIFIRLTGRGLAG